MQSDLNFPVIPGGSGWSFQGRIRSKRFRTGGIIKYLRSPLSIPVDAIFKFRTGGIIKYLRFYKALFLSRRPFIGMRGNKGAIILEYVLLLLACLGFAMLIKAVVEIGSNPDESGWVIRTWMAVIEVIANDI